MAQQSIPTQANMGIFVKNISVMIDFYQRVIGVDVSDRLNEGHHKPEIIFSGGDVEIQHRFILVTERPEDAEFGVTHQVSFRVNSLDELKDIAIRFKDENVSGLEAKDHGDVWALYLCDPEGNLLEVYATTPWQTRRPYAAELDIDLPSEIIFDQTQKRIEAQIHSAQA